MSCGQCHACRRCGHEVTGNDRWSRLCLHCANRTIGELKAKVKKYESTNRKRSP